MATIFKTTGAKARISYRAQVCVVMETGQRQRISKTFASKRMAEAWANKMEKESEKFGVNLPVKRRFETVRELIDHHIRMTAGTLGKTAHSCLRNLRDTALADVRCEELTSSDIVDCGIELSGRTRMLKGVLVPISKSTVLNYLMHLSSVLSLAEDAYGTPIDDLAMTKALKSLRKLRKIAKSKKRDRRPSLSELDTLLSYLNDPANESECAPMVKIIAFAIFSSRRLSEITRLEWNDLDSEKKRILVRKMKNPDPEKKEQNDVWVDIPERAMKIILSMPRVSKFIFPFNPGSIGTAFQCACKKVEIVDLRFHDLRHEAISLYHEMGLHSWEVMRISGHTDLSGLARYNQPETAGDKYAGWKWFERACAPETFEEREARLKWIELNKKNAPKREAKKTKTTN